VVEDNVSADSCLHTPACWHTCIRSPCAHSATHVRGLPVPAWLCRSIIQGRAQHLPPLTQPLQGHGPAAHQHLSAPAQPKQEGGSGAGPQVQVPVKAEGRDTGRRETQGSSDGPANSKVGGRKRAASSAHPTSGRQPRRGPTSRASSKGSA
jgi:hypothetical protein